MLSRALQCDHCGHIELLSAYKFSQVQDEGICDGWVRIQALSPAERPWARDAIVNIPGPWDLCSIHCVHSIFYDATASLSE